MVPLIACMGEKGYLKVGLLIKSLKAYEIQNIPVYIIHNYLLISDKSFSSFACTIFFNTNKS